MFCDAGGVFAERISGLVATLSVTRIGVDKAPHEECQIHMGVVCF